MVLLCFEGKIYRDIIILKLGLESGRMPVFQIEHKRLGNDGEHRHRNSDTGMALITGR